jgi:hypothetical protein
MLRDADCDIGSGAKRWGAPSVRDWIFLLSPWLAVACLIIWDARDQTRKAAGGNFLGGSNWVPPRTKAPEQDGISKNGQSASEIGQPSSENGTTEAKII